MKSLLTLLERLRLSTKLVVGFSVGILIALLIGLNTLASLNTLEQEVESMYENDLLGISHLKEANYHFLNLGRALRHGLLVEDDAARHAAIAQVKRSREKLLSELAEARKRIFRPDVIAQYDAYQKDLNKVFESFEHMQALLQKEGRFSPSTIKAMTSPELGAIFANSSAHMSEMISLKETGAKEALDKIHDLNRQARQMAIALIAIGGGIAVLLGALISLSIQRPNQRLRQSVEELAAGKVDSIIPHTDYPNEVGIMARAIGVLQGIYRQSNDQHWVKSHLSDINAALQTAEDFRSLAQLAVSKIAPVIGAGHGAFYIHDSGDRYQLQASYGYRERKHLSSSFAVGEGLVGQCAMEKASIVLMAPKDYIRINSGLGEGPPACISVMPVIMGDRVLGVLEMASFQAFNDREKVLMEALLPTLATSLEILDRNMKTKELLAATQEQAERMEKQAAQLEEQQVEMEAQQAELMETENWFRSIIESAPDGMLVADASGRILLANLMADRIFGYEPGELLGMQVDQLVPDSIRGTHGAMRASFMNNGSKRTMEGSPRLKGLRKDGSELPLAITLSPLPSRGDRGACVSISVRRIEN